MTTFEEVILSILIGIGFGLITAFSIYISMFKYREEYREWWTPRRYKIMVVITAIITTLVVFFGYFGNN